MEQPNSKLTPSVPPLVQLERIVIRSDESLELMPSTPIWLMTPMLLIIHEGQGSIMLNGDLHLVMRGKCFLLVPNTAIEIMSEQLAPLKLHQLFFQIIRDDAALFEQNIEVTIEAFTFIEDLVQQLTREYDSQTSLNLFQSHIRFQQLLFEVLKNQHTKEQEPNSIRAVERSISYINHSYHEDIEVGRLAVEANMSRWQYGVLFKSLTGQTPMDYLTNLRMKHAKQLMFGSISRIRDIAGKVGFRDEYYFSRRFKQTTGMTPTQYMHDSTQQPRIFSIQYLGELLALGIRPVGTNTVMLQDLQEASMGVQGIDEPIDIQQLMLLKPDLILFPSFTPAELVDQLIKIAPSVEVSWYDDVYSRMRNMGNILGKRKEAGDWIARYKAKAERTQKRLGGHVRLGETASAFIYHNQNLYVYAGHHFGHTLYQGVGFNVPDSIKSLIEQDKNLKWKAISIEALPEYAGDRVFLALSDTGEDAVGGQSILNHPVWQSLPAVLNGQGYVVDQSWGNYNPITLERHLDEMVKWIEDQSRHAKVAE